MIVTRTMCLMSLCTLALVGCARYEYDVVEPADLAQHVGSKSAVSFTRDGIRYEAQSSSDRLVLFIHNEGNDPLKMLGEDGYAVDPEGESHPLPTRTIAPGTSTKLIFPPVRPTFKQSGPSFGFGVGVGVSRGYGRSPYYGVRQPGYDPFYDDAPRYYRLEDDGTNYWDWKGDGTLVKVRLVYQRGEDPNRFHHEFTFRRVKVS